MQNRSRIVVVDDETTLTHLMKEILSIEGHEVEMFNDSARALDYCLNNAGQIDLIITDQTMPSVTGRELAQAVLKVQPGLPIILCTGYSNQINEELAQQIGIQAYFDKPLNLGHLSDKVGELLAMSQF